MSNIIIVSLSLTFVYVAEATGRSMMPPNILLIIADDLGWNDVSFHGSNQILTPNMDVLAFSGITLGRYYTHCSCTPSRSALLTGKYAHTLGMQGLPLLNSEDRGVPRNVKLLPQYLKELGYATHLVGKWHLGSSRTEFLPTSRGFCSHMGHRGGYIDYEKYNKVETWSIGNVSGFDLFRNNKTVAWDTKGYVTDVYTREAKSIIMRHDNSRPLFLMVAHNAPHASNDAAPLQAPLDTVRQMKYIKSPERRIFAAMTKKLDDSVGDIFRTLHRKGMLDETVVIFISDNGGMTSGVKKNYASNWPLRGLKMSPFEGGIRVAGLIWSAEFNHSHHLWKGYMHAIDWLPTILSIAGSKPPRGIDGFDLWNNIKFNKDSRREEFVEIDDYQGFDAIISGDFKLVTGNINPAYSDHQGDDLRGIIGREPLYIKAIKNSKVYKTLCEIGKLFETQFIKLRNTIRVTCDKKGINLCYPNSKGKLCLFNIIQDQCETDDLSEMYPELVGAMLTRLQTEKSRTIARRVPAFRDPRSLPRLFNNTWFTWADNLPYNEYYYWSALILSMNKILETARKFSSIIIYGRILTTTPTLVFGRKIINEIEIII